MTVSLSCRQLKKMRRVIRSLERSLRSGRGLGVVRDSRGRAHGSCQTVTVTINLGRVAQQARREAKRNSQSPTSGESE